MKETTIIPECWEEMEPRHFRRLLRLVCAMMADRAISKTDVLRLLAHHICGAPRFIRRERAEEYPLLLDAVADNLAWIFREEEGLTVFDFCTTRNLIPMIGNLKGPQSHGSDLRFEEYRVACDLYNRYTLEHDPALLDALCGVLYRKPAKKGRPYGRFREPFDKYAVNRYAARMKRVPPWLKWGVYNWFGYFCRYLIQGVFIIEGREVSFAPVFGRGQDPDAGRDDSLGMTAILFSLAETGAFGNLQQTNDALLFDVLLKLLADKQQVDKLKKKK